MADEKPAKDDGKGNDERPPITAADVSDFFTKQVIAGIFSGAPHEPWQVHVRRLGYGALGGVFYTCLKNYFGAGIGIYGLLAMDPMSPNRTELMFGYFGGFVASGLVGAVVAWLSAQRSGRLLFLIGMFGVQILLTIFPGLQSKSSSGALSLGVPLISSAYAQTALPCVGETAFTKGFRAAFGVREQPDKFAVVVASGKNPDDAQNKLRAISAKDSTLKLRVGPRACDNDYYPIYATDLLSLNDAKAALDNIKKTTGITDAFLSPGPLAY
jgi:hypothetical protein